MSSIGTLFGWAGLLVDAGRLSTDCLACGGVRVVQVFLPQTVNPAKVERLRTLAGGQAQVRGHPPCLPCCVQHARVYMWDVDLIRVLPRPSRFKLQACSFSPVNPAGLGVQRGAKSRQCSPSPPQHGLLETAAMLCIPRAGHRLWQFCC